jgi:hypothetical protein
MDISVQHKLRKKLHDVYAMEPNNLGPDWMTWMYKRVSSPLKSMPFFIIIPVSGLIAVTAYVILGRFAIALVSLLQHGF